MSDHLPAYCFTIPSISDGIPLDCRIYHPHSIIHNDSEALGSPQIQAKQGAVIAHPYAPLGGCMDDPVVMTVVEQLLAMDFVVGTFNFRGAAKSKGSTSWSGKAERDDYISVAGHMMFYLNQLELPHPGRGGPIDDPSASESLLSGCVTLVLAGYSYGSLILSQLPSTPDILALFHSSPPSASIPEIIVRAKTLATQTNTLLLDQVEVRGRLPGASKAHHHQNSDSQHSIIYGGCDAPSPAGRRSTDFVRKSVEIPGRLKHAMSRSSKPSTPVKPQSLSPSPGIDTAQGSLSAGRSLPHVSTHYLLISPLLSPLSNFLSVSTTSLLFWRPSSSPDNLVRNPTLLIFGTDDIFTSSRKLEGWCKRISGLSSQAAGPSSRSSFRWKVVEGAGHFWREIGVEGIMREAVAEWLRDAVTINSK